MPHLRHPPLLYEEVKHLYFFNSYVGDMDRCGVAVLAHIELESSVVIVLLGHVESEFECLPLFSQVDRGVREVPDPSGIRCRYANDTLPCF